MTKSTQHPRRLLRELFLEDSHRSFFSAGRQSQTLHFRILNTDSSHVLEPRGLRRRHHYRPPQASSPRDHCCRSTTSRLETPSTLYCNPTPRTAFVALMLLFVSKLRKESAYLRHIDSIMQHVVTSSCRTTLRLWRGGRLER